MDESTSEYELMERAFALSEKISLSVSLSVSMDEIREGYVRTMRDIYTRDKVFK